MVTDVRKDYGRCRDRLHHRGEEAKRRWQEIFKLLEAGEREISKDAPDKSDGPENDQLRLF